MEKAEQICHLWAQTYPHDKLPHEFLGSSTSTTLGKFEQAEGSGKKAIELDPDHSMAYSNLAEDYVFQNRLTEAQATLQRAAERKLDIPEFLITRYRIAFLKGDQMEMKRVSELGEGRSDVGDLFHDRKASIWAYSGHLQEARQESQRAVDVLQIIDRHHDFARAEPVTHFQQAVRLGR